MRRVRLPLLAAMAWMGLTAAPWAVAQDFRVETDVFFDKKEPVAQYLTLFVGGKVYDFMFGQPNEITIYDIPRERFLLLAPDRRVQATVTCDELRQWTAGIQAVALESKDDETRFLANPVFNRDYNPQSRRLVLSSQWLKYTAEASSVSPPNPGVVRRYRDFADWYARLNGMRLGNMPPFARMKLNEELEIEGLVPGEVVKAVTSRSVFGKEIEVRSKHLFTWRVLPSDEKRINEANAHVISFNHVSIKEYLKWPERVANRRE